MCACGGDDDDDGTRGRGGNGGTGGSGGAAGNTAAFAIKVEPIAAPVLRDSRRWVKVELAREASFVGDVQVSLTNPPAGVTGDVMTFTGAFVSDALQIEIGPDTALGELSVTISAASGGASTSAVLALNVQAAQPTAPRKIEAARLAAQIDLGTALLYRCYARFGDDRLPEEFRGSGADEDLMLPRDIELATPQLSAPALAALRPFTVRPHHPDSVYRSTSSQLDRIGARAAPPAECAGGNAWRSERSPAVPVRVWIECGDAISNATEQHAMTRVLRVFETLWPTMTGHMGAPLLDAGGEDEGGDDAIDVYLVEGAIQRGGDTEDIYKLINLGVNAYAAWSPPYKKNAAGKGISSGYLVLPRIGMLGEKMRSTITHEFFHVLQFAHHDTYDLAVNKNPYWFVEASATWASVHFDRTLSWPARVAAEEHKGRFGRFQRETRALNDPDRAHIYAAYIWPLFLEQRSGSRDIIAAIWNGLEGASDAAQADTLLDGKSSFATNFHTFALRNLNSAFMPGDPLPRSDRYVTLDPLFPDEAIQPIKTIAPLGNYTKGLDMPPLSASYFLFTPDADTIRKVVFEFSGLQPQSELDVDALVHTQDGWLPKPVSLTGQGRVVFCFDKGKSTDTIRGSFDAIELVLSNHARAADARISGDLVVTSSTAPCGVWVGSTTTTTRHADDAFTSQTVTTTTGVVLEFDAETALLSPAKESPYRIRSGTYQSNSLFQSVSRVPACRTIGTTSGTMRWALPMDASPGATSANLTLNTDSQPATYAGSGFTWATFTNTSNCNDRNVDITTSGLNALFWWDTPFTGALHALQADGVTARGSVDVPDGTGRGSIKYEWTFTKRDE